MSARSSRDPSPFRSGLVHSALGAFTLTLVLGSGASAMHMFGSSSDASPAVRMALFDDAPGDAPQLNPRLPGYQEAIGLAEATPPAGSFTQNSGSEPDLGVEYSGAQAVTAVASTESAPKGIRINGKTVMPGQSYSQVSQTVQIAASMTTNETGEAQAPAAPALLPSAPLMRNARAFANPDNKPTVSIIVGGLGTNATRTRAAINDLPPEVTLAFAPTADNLSGWVRQARRAGHEVLIEVPMEPYDFGRQSPHAHVMRAELSPEENKQRLAKLLARTPGYIGVMNYQGAKFATNPAAVDPIMAELSDKGLAMFEDGNLVRSEFSSSAKKSRLAFGKATSAIDSIPGADEISQQLLLLESTARERGAALGTGTPFPVTFDILQEWLPTLEEKGIALAPASHYAKRSLRSGQIQQASLDPQG
ncbi:MAG: divergent polysaccharide deacetylase family protein [Hyphomonadaceae bacterium]|nr:divergent polysaccharide deacetylase family protein [Hyphomonadaceae bacterium]